MSWLGRLLCWIGYHDGEAIGEPVASGWITYVECRCRRCGATYVDKQE